MQNETVKKDKCATAGLVFGILSIFLWEFSIFPILAIIFSTLGITRTIKQDGTNLSSAIWGAVLGVVFLIIRVAQL